MPNIIKIKNSNRAKKSLNLPNYYIYTWPNLMPFIFAKWATAHALNLMGLIASHIKAHKLSGTPSLFRFLTILISPLAQTQDPIFLPPRGLRQHRQRRSRRYPRGLHPCLMQSKPWSRLQCFNAACKQRLVAPKNGASNSAWTALQMTPPKARKDAWNGASKGAFNGAWRMLEWRWDGGWGVP